MLVFFATMSDGLLETICTKPRNIALTHTTGYQAEMNPEHKMTLQ